MNTEAPKFLEKVVQVDVDELGQMTENVSMTDAVYAANLAYKEAFKNAYKLIFDKLTKQGTEPTLIFLKEHLPA